MLPSERKIDILPYNVSAILKLFRSRHPMIQASEIAKLTPVAGQRLGVSAALGLNPVAPPQHLNLSYSEVNGVHTFHAVEVPGLVVLHHDLRDAFNSAVEGVSELVSDLCGCRVTYLSDMKFEQFEQVVHDKNSSRLPDFRHTISVSAATGHVAT
jgi:hypothetical protein